LFIQAFKHQISDLVVTISDETSQKLIQKWLIRTYVGIFGLLANLNYLDVNVYDIYSFPRSLLNGLSSIICSSSSIAHLRIRLHNLNDCLCLLDGRLSQLHTLIVNLDYIRDSSEDRFSSNRIRNNSSNIINNRVQYCME